MWQLIDNSDGKSKGYLRIMRDGVRVADVFPYANDAQGPDVEWTVAMAHHIVDTMNARDMLRFPTTDGRTG